MDPLKRVSIQVQIETGKSEYRDTFDNIHAFAQWWNQHGDIHRDSYVETRLPFLAAEEDDDDGDGDGGFPRMPAAEQALPDETEAVKRDGKMYRRVLWMAPEKIKLSVQPHVLAMDWDLIEFQYIDGRFRIYGLTRLNSHEEGE